MKYHILSIGVSKHKIVRSLQYCHKDATELYHLFVSNVPNLGFTKLLVDSEANLTDIRTALASKDLTKCDEKDAFFLFFSGHGTVDADEAGNALAHYLVPFDATEDFASSCISVDYLKDALSKIPCKEKFVIIDSCFSGAVSKGKYLPNKLHKDLKTIKTISDVIPGTGSFTLTASKDDEVSWEDPKTEHGLFTSALLKELTKRRAEKHYPVLSIVPQIMEEVVKRSNAEFPTQQTPTLEAKFEGNVVLPVFKVPLPVSPALLEVPTPSEESASSTISTPVLDISDIEKQKMVDDLVKLVAATNAESSRASHTAYHRFTWQLINELRETWDKIFQKYDGQVDMMQTALMELEGAAYQFIALGGITAAFGSKESMQIYSESLASINEWTFGRSGLIALINIPYIIPLLAVNTIGIVCIGLDNLDPLEIALNAKQVNLNNPDDDPYPIMKSTEIFFGRAVGGYADKANDHIRQALEEYDWLSVLVPRVDGKIMDFQLQTNFIMSLIMEKNDLRVWPDYGRFYGSRIAPLVARLKYDDKLIKQLATILNVDSTKLRHKMAELVASMADRGISPYFWDSVRPENLLTEAERSSS